jgi:hypothetical protein
MLASPAKKGKQKKAAVGRKRLPQSGLRHIEAQTHGRCALATSSVNRG